MARGEIFWFKPGMDATQYREFSSRAAPAIARFQWLTSTPRTIRLLPDACDYLIYREGRGLSILSGNRRDFEELKLPAGRVDGWKLFPGTAAALLGMDARDLPSRAPVTIHELSPVPAVVTELLHRLEPEERAQRDGPAAMLHAVLEALTRANAAPSRTDNQRLMHYMAARMAEAHSLRTLAADYGMSMRTMERKFRAVCGLSPAEFRSVARFFSAYRLLQGAQDASRPHNLTGIAYDAGYSDQAHFIRDFRRFAGLRPGDARRNPERYGLTFNAPET